MPGRQLSKHCPQQQGNGKACKRHRFFVTKEGKQAQKRYVYPVDYPKLDMWTLRRVVSTLSSRGDGVDGLRFSEPISSFLTFMLHGRHLLLRSERIIRFLPTFDWITDSFQSIRAGPQHYIAHSVSWRAHPHAYHPAAM